jgi:hypothetical protein
MNWGGIKHLSADTVWKCAAPKKAKLVARLLIRGRIKVRSVLFKQQIVDDDLCPFCCHTRETAEHFALDCGHTELIAWDLVVTAALWFVAI